MVLLAPPSPNVLINGLRERIFRTISHELLNHLSTLKDQQRWDPGDLITHRSRAVGIDVHFSDLEFALVVLRQLIHDRSQRAARAAPGRPKVYQHRSEER